MNRLEINKLRKEFIRNFNENDLFSALEIAEKIISYYNNDGSYEYCLDLYNLSIIQQKMGKYQMCIRYYKKILNILNKEEYNTSDKEDIKALNLCIDVENALGVYYSKNSTKINLSLESFVKAFNLVKKYSGDDSKKLTMILHNMGCCYYDLGQYDNAIYHHLEELSLRKENNMDFVDNLNFLGYDYEKIKNYDKSVGYFSQALEIIKGIKGVNSEEYIANLYYLASIYTKMEDYTTAIKLYENNCHLIEQKLGIKHPYLAECLTKLSENYIRINEFEQALKIQQKSLNIIKDTVGEKHIYYGSNLKRLGDLYFILGNLDKCVFYYEEENKIKRDIIGIYNEDFVNSILNLINVYVHLENFEKEEELAESLYKMVDFDLPREAYKKALLILAKIYLQKDMLDNIYNVYNHFRNVDNLISFDDMLKLAESVEEDILTKEKKLSYIYKDFEEEQDDIDEDINEGEENIFNGIKNLFDGIKREVDRIDQKGDILDNEYTEQFVKESELEEETEQPIDEVKENLEDEVEKDNIENNTEVKFIDETEDNN